VGVNGTRDAKLVLDVKLWDGVLVVDGSIGDVTDGSLLNHVADQETLDGLVLLMSRLRPRQAKCNVENGHLWHATTAVGAADGLDVATSMLVASSISSLLGLTEIEMLALYAIRKESKSCGGDEVEKERNGKVVHPSIHHNFCAQFELDDATLYKCVGLLYKKIK
jgi:hypothetical protein